MPYVLTSIAFGFIPFIVYYYYYLFSVATKTRRSIQHFTEIYQTTDSHPKTTLSNLKPSDMQ